MLTQDYIITTLRAQRPYLATEFGVSKIGLFGSFAQNQAHDTSDVDLVVEFERPIGLKFIALVDYLEKLLGRKVDVLTPTGIKDIRIPQVARNITESILYV